jgi:site-specific recombinase XerD
MTTTLPPATTAAQGPSWGMTPPPSRIPMPRLSSGVFASRSGDPSDLPPSSGENPQKHHSNEKTERPGEILSSDEVTQIISGCSSSARSRTGIRNRALLTLLYRSGLRISEALAIRPSDIDLENHSIRLRATKSGGPQTRGFHPAADDALLRWIDTRAKAGIRGRTLFCTLQGGEVWPQYVRTLLHRLAEKAGLTKRVHPHAFRHTFAVELMRGGTHISVISKLLGHKSIATTARYLDHLTNNEAVQALQTADLPPLVLTS